MMRTGLTLTAAVLVAGCMTGSGESGASGRTSLAAADGGARGTATVSEAAGGLQVSVQAEGLPPGAHGIHVHAVGRCEAPEFTTAGPHWNPTDRKHGRDNPDGAHHGDLPNIQIGADGRGSLNFVIPSASFAQLFDGDGAALVVHATADDYRSDPSGNSGGRIACGVITRN
jgi:superoxide dismutase, Cu-Zn family